MTSLVLGGAVYAWYRGIRGAASVPVGWIRTGRGDAPVRFAVGVTSYG